MSTPPLSQTAPPPNQKAKQKEGKPPESLGHRAADLMAKGYGSWWFIWVQACIMVVWITFNTVSLFSDYQFDKPMFILLNLFMSAEAAFATPIILMASNRSADFAQAQNKAVLDSIERVLDIQTNLLVETRNATIAEDNIVVETQKDPETLVTEITVTKQ